MNALLVFPVTLYITKYIQITASLFFREIPYVSCWLQTPYAVWDLQAADPRPYASWHQEKTVMVRSIHLPAECSHQVLRKGRARGQNDAWGKAAGLHVEQPCFWVQSNAGHLHHWLWASMERCPMKRLADCSRNPSRGEGAYVPGKLCPSEAACLGSWLLQWVLVPPKWVLLCYWFQLEQCLARGVHHPERPTRPGATSST